MTICYVVGVDIAVTDRDGVSIRCIVHGVSKVFVECRYDSDNSDGGVGGLRNLLQPGCKKKRRVRSNS